MAVRARHATGQRCRRRRAGIVDRTRKRRAARRPRGVTRERQDVVHVCPAAGANLDGLHPLVFGEVGGKRDPLVLHLAHRRHRERFLHGEDGIGCADAPPLGECRRGRQIAVVPPGRPGRRPLDDDVALGIAHPPIVREAPALRVRMPRRHGAVQHLVAHRARPRPGLVIRDQRHRCDLARTMTRGAVLVEDGRDVFRERRRRRRGSVLRGLRRNAKGRSCDRGGNEEGASQSVHATEIVTDSPCL